MIILFLFVSHSNSNYNNIMNVLCFTGMFSGFVWVLFVSSHRLESTYFLAVLFSFFVYDEDVRCKSYALHLRSSSNSNLCIVDGRSSNILDRKSDCIAMCRATAVSWSSWLLQHFVAPNFQYQPAGLYTSCVEIHRSADSSFDCMTVKTAWAWTLDKIPEPWNSFFLWCKRFQCR